MKEDVNLCLSFWASTLKLSVRRVELLRNPPLGKNHHFDLRPRRAQLRRNPITQQPLRVRNHIEPKVEIFSRSLSSFLSCRLVRPMAPAKRPARRRYGGRQAVI